MHSALALSLSAEQMTRMVDYACDRIAQLDSDLRGEPRWAQMEQWERISASNFDHRLSSDPSAAKTIFDRSNKSLQVVRSVKRFKRARLMKDLFGSSPWFYAKPEGEADQVLVGQIQDHAEWKLRQADFKEKAREVIDTTLDLGMCVVQTTWKVVEDKSERLALCLTDRATGEPVTTATGDFIFQDDETVEVPVAMPADMAMEAESQFPPMDPELEAEPAMPAAPMTQTEFVKAPGLVLDSRVHEWREHLVEERTKLYSGLCIDPVYWKDVLFPINQAWEDADFLAVRKSRRPSQLRAQFAPDVEALDPQGEANAEGATMTPADADVRKIIDEIAVSADRTPVTEADMPKTEHGENEVRTADDDDEPVKVYECYFDYDCFEDGNPRRVWMTLHAETRKAVWADYRIAIAPRAQKPLHMIRMEKVPGRAYGRGLFEIFEQPAECADRLLNAILYHNSYNSDPAKFINTDAIKNLKGKKDIELGPGLTFQLDGQGTRASDAWENIVIPDLDERTWQLMNLFLQLIQTESGALNPAQAAISDSPTTETATGTNALTNIADLLHQDSLDELRASLQKPLGFGIELIYMKADAAETFEYLEGKASGVLELKDAVRLRKMPMNVEILLTRAKKAEEKQGAMEVIPVGMQFDTMLPATQLRMRPAFVQLFRANGFDNADQYFPPPEEIAQMVLATLQMEGWALVNPAGQVQPPPGMPAAEGGAAPTVLPGPGPATEAAA